MLTDLKFAIRSLLKSPIFTAIAVLTLALGIGASTAIFSIVDTVLLRPLPFPEPERLVMIWTDNPAVNVGFHELPASPHELWTWRTQARSFEQVTGINSRAADLSGKEGAERVGGVGVTSNFFATLGVQPRLGRAFTAAEEQPGHANVAIISDRVWQKRFAGDPHILGRVLMVNRQPYTIIGVMPPSFDFPRGTEMPSAYNLLASTDIWVPEARDAAAWQELGERNPIVIGRLRPGATRSQAQADLDTLMRRQAEQFPDTAGWIAWVRPLEGQVTGHVRPVLLVLLGAVAIVLLIASANVANLLLSRAIARRRELAIRGALGAARWRVIRQSLAESIGLATLSGIGGIVLALAGVDLILHWSPPNIPRLRDTTLDWKVLAFAIGVSLFASLLAGLAPAWQASQINLTEAINSDSRGSTAGGRQKLQSAIVAVEVALAVVLLVAAGLMGRSLQRLESVDPGFRPQQVVTFDVNPIGSKIDEDSVDRARRFFRDLRSRILNIPGIERAGAISSLPLGGSANLMALSIEGVVQSRPTSFVTAEGRVITPGYFDALHIPILEGRDIRVEDTADKPLVGLVNEAIVHTFLKGTDPIGHRVKIGAPDGSGPWLTIVGVVRDVRSSALEEKALPQVYMPTEQRFFGGMTFVVEAKMSAAALERAMRETVKSLDPQTPVANYRPMTQLVDNALARPRFGTLLFGLFAGVALVMTLVGLSGVVGYAVTLRTREIGIRIALGAQVHKVLAWVLQQGFWPMLAGLAVGVAGAFVLSRLLTSLLYEIAPTDPLTFVGAVLAIAFTTLAACYLPARRATKVDPLIALRAE